MDDQSTEPSDDQAAPEPYEPPLAETLEGPDPDSVTPGGMSA